MARWLMTVGLILNALSLAVFVGGLAYAHIKLPLASRMYVTELDRAGVFCEEHLRNYDAALAENLRANVGPFIAQDHQKAIVWVAVLGIGVTSANALLLVGLQRKASGGKST